MSGLRLRNSERGYGAVAKLFHWLVALLVIGMLIVGYIMVNVLQPFSSLQITMYQWHKIFGVTVLGLVLVRLAWRAFNPVPRMPEGLGRGERLGARLTHWGFYALLLAMPATGLLIQASFAQRDQFSGWIMDLFPFLRAVPVNERLHETVIEIHEIVAWVVFALLLIHVAAALRHHFLKKDDVLKRMLPGRRP